MIRKLLLAVTVVFFFSNCLKAQFSNYALTFNGVNDYVSIPDEAGFSFPKITIEMWINWKKTGGFAADFLISKGYEQLGIHTAGQNGLYSLRFIPTPGLYIDTDPEIFNSNIWYHIAYSYDPVSAEGKFYKNGVPGNIHVAKGNLSMPIASTAGLPFNLGKRVLPDGSEYYYLNGMIDEVRIWNTIRTPSEILNNIQNELAGNETGLVAYYKMNENGGSTITDHTTHGHTGSLINGTTWVLNDTPLPVELISFAAELENSNVLLDWQTATEVNNYGFDIERKHEAGNWEKIAFIPGNGNSHSPKNYSYIDHTLKASGKYQYRLKQIDFDGSPEYSFETGVDFNEIPFSLEQNYPNPFNPATFISYQFSNDSKVSLKIYNSLGVEVKTLVDEFKPAGRYSVRYDASNLTSGIYYYTLRAGEFSSIKKMIYLK